MIPRIVWTLWWQYSCSSTKWRKWNKSWELTSANTFISLSNVKLLVNLYMREKTTIMSSRASLNVCVQGESQELTSATLYLPLMMLNLKIWIWWVQLQLAIMFSAHNWALHHFFISHELYNDVIIMSTAASKGFTLADKKSPWNFFIFNIKVSHMSC